MGYEDEKVFYVGHVQQKITTPLQNDLSNVILGSKYILFSRKKWKYLEEEETGDVAVF